jgi:hypothetical protein
MASLESKLIVYYQGISSMVARLLTELPSPGQPEIYHLINALDDLLALSYFEC